MNSNALTETDSRPAISPPLIPLEPVEAPAKICPCLGLPDDPETRFSFPAQGNACHRAAAAAPLTLDHQAHYCLSAEYRHCPIFRYNAHLAAGRPRAPRALALLKQQPLAAILLLSGLVLLGLFGFWRGRVAGQAAEILAASQPDAAAITPAALPPVDLAALETGTATAVPPTATALPTPAATATSPAAPLAGLAKLIVPRPVSAGGPELAPPSPTPMPPTPTPPPTLSPEPSPPAAPLCLPRRDWPAYLVRPGDTLFSLAQARGTTVTALMIANCLNTARIMAGQLLYLPPLPATAVPPPTVTPQPATATPPPATELPPPNPTATPSIPSPVTNTPAAAPTLIPPPSDTPPPTETPAPPPTHTPAPPPADRPPAP